MVGAISTCILDGNVRTVLVYTSYRNAKRSLHFRSDTGTLLDMSPLGSHRPENLQRRVATCGRSSCKQNRDFLGYLSPHVIRNIEMLTVCIYYSCIRLLIV